MNESGKGGSLPDPEKLKSEGITRCAAHSVATTAHQVDSINAFVMEAHRRYPDRIVPFAAMHPALDKPVETAEAVIRQGFCGVKLHPEIQRFKIDDPRVMDMLAIQAPSGSSA